jgi:hypothetical protein
MGALHAFFKDYAIANALFLKIASLFVYDHAHCRQSIIHGSIGPGKGE